MFLVFIYFGVYVEEVFSGVCIIIGVVIFIMVFIGCLL